MKATNKNTEKPSIWKRILNELSVNRNLYILSIPVILYFLIFKYGPMFGIIIAFKDYNIRAGFIESPWVGLKYFKEFFGGMYFGRILSNTLIISFYNILFGFPAPIIFALMLNALRNEHFKKGVQTATYLPHFISMVVICGMIADFFSADGVVTKLITLLGGEKMNYLGDARYFRPIYVITEIWQSVGWGSIIYLAALSGIDAQLYEAAEIDGASRLRQLWHVTLPGIANTIIIMLILRIGQIINIGYEKIILLYSTATYETADVISSYVYRMGLGNSRYSFSTAVGLFQSVVNVVMLISANTISKKYTETALF